jgi:hypothetical protein
MVQYTQVRFCVGGGGGGKREGEEEEVEEKGEEEYDDDDDDDTEVFHLLFRETLTALQRFRSLRHE